MKTVIVFVCCIFLAGCSRQAKRDASVACTADTTLPKMSVDTVSSSADINKKDSLPPLIIIKEGEFPEHKDTVEIEYIPSEPVHYPASSTPAKGKIRWAHLVDEDEDVVQLYYNRAANRIDREKSDEIVVQSTVIGSGSFWFSLLSPLHTLTYKQEAEFYREDKRGQLHEVKKAELPKESVGRMFPKGEIAEIGVSFPDNILPGDYLLKIKIYDENGTCYVVSQWLEAYTDKQMSHREKPISLEPGKTHLTLPDDTITTEADEVFDVVQHMPEFPGGMSELMKFIHEHLHHSLAADCDKEEKRIIIQVIIDKDGSIIHPTVIRGNNPALNKEALRVVGLMPKWKAGHQFGVNLKVRFTFPVKFEDLCND